jgi:PAS domain S-box-containing protein
MFPPPPKLFARLAGSFVCLLGLVVLMGWALDIAPCKSVFPGLATMKANTAVGLALCGSALALLSGERRWTTRRLTTSTIALAVVILGALTLGEYFFGWNVGIDQFLFRDEIKTIGISQPGRMSPATAFCFILTGIALWTASRQRLFHLRLPVLAGLGATLATLGGAATLGQFSNALFGFRLWNYLGMAVHTALGFVFLGTGLLAEARAEEKTTWALGKSTTTGFICAAAIMLMAAGVSWNYTAQLQEASNWVSQTQQVLKEIEDVRAGMTSLESNQRGYLLLGDENLLAPRAQVKLDIHQSLQTLRGLTADNPRQQRRLDQLEPLMVRRTAFGDQTIVVRRKQGFSAAQHMLALGTGIKLSADIENVLQAMRNEEYGLLEIREKQSEAVSTATFLLLPLGVFVSLTILSLALFFLNAGINERALVEQKLAAIVNSSNDAIIGKDLHSIVTSWNAGAEKIFGYSAKEMIGQSITRLIPADRQQEESVIIDRVGRGESVEHFETLRAAKDGHLLDISVTVSPIRDKSGKIVGASKVARDVTERKRVEQEIQELNVRLEQRVTERTAELEAANKELEAFSYSVSHDLRAPLRAVDGFSQAVLEDYGAQLPEEGRRDLQTIREGAQRMGLLIDDLLAFCRLSRSPLNKQKVNTTEQVRNVLRKLEFQQEGRKVDVRLGDLPACAGSPAMLEQVWMNLLSNAFKYTRECEKAVVEIGGKIEHSEIIYFVRDNGAGFDMKYAHKLFGVFQRLHRADEFEGTGVGLAIVQRIVHRHGGRVWAEAAVNRGATFYFTLPEKDRP